MGHGLSWNATKDVESLRPQSNFFFTLWSGTPSATQLIFGFRTLRNIFNVNPDTENNGYKLTAMTQR